MTTDKEGVSEIGHPCRMCLKEVTNATSCCSEKCHLLKEANYGIYDLENDAHYACKKDKESFREYAIKRLINFAKYELKHINGNR